MDRNEKNLKIKETYAATKMRRKNMTCRAFTMKVQQNKLNKLQKEQLAGQFREAKWVYNSILSQSKEGRDIFSFTEKDFDTVTHLDKDKNPLTDSVVYLSKRELQAVVAGVKNNIANLSKAKKKSLKVGSLRFISEYNSINLPQYGVNYKIVGGNRIKVDKIKRPLYVRGLDQLSHLHCEYANARLVRRASGYYVIITVYFEKEPETDKPGMIGIDMGCENTATLSTGEKFNFQVEETERLKRLQHILERKKKGSRNRWKLRFRIRREYERISNKKNDAANKFVSRMKGCTVVIQDEQLSSWMENGHGKKVHHGILGRIKERLVSDGCTYVLSKWLPTTKLCTECGCKVDMTVGDRVFTCPVCGHTEDRDVHAARNMLWFFSRRKTLCVERTEYNRVLFERSLSELFCGEKHDATKSSV